MIHGSDGRAGVQRGDRGHRPDPAADGGDQQDGEEADGLPDGVLDRHPVGLDGTGGGGGVHALELRLGGGIRARVLRGRELGRRAEVARPAGRRGRS